MFVSHNCVHTYGENRMAFLNAVTKCLAQATERGYFNIIAHLASTRMRQLATLHPQDGHRVKGGTSLACFFTSLIYNPRPWDGAAHRVGLPSLFEQAWGVFPWCV